MAAKIGELTREELSQIVEEIVERKLLAVFGDPDDSLEIQEALRDRLVGQQTAVADGERGSSLEDVLHQLV